MHFSEGDNLSAVLPVFDGCGIAGCRFMSPNPLKVSNENQLSPPNKSCWT